MKSVIALLTAPLALAAPALESRDLPNLTPVHVNGIDIEFDFKCGTNSSKWFSLLFLPLTEYISYIGGVTVKAAQASKAVQWGVDLQMANQQVGCT